MVDARRHLRDARKAVEDLEQRVDELEQRSREKERRIDNELEEDLAEVDRKERERLSRVRRKYRRDVEETRKNLNRLAKGVGTWAASWDDSAWSSFSPRPAPPPVIRFGELEVTTPPNGPDREEYDVLRTPAMIPFVGGRGVVFSGQGEALEEAAATVRSLVLRLLTQVPPGKLRLLLIDPEGLGENLAAFMGLKEHLSKLVSGKIWVDRSDIDEQLADLSSHMQTVIQSYLQGRFDTLEEYNREAKEIAEPYRLLVALNFPKHFSPKAASRLASLVSKGPRCGIFPVITLDRAQDAPRGFDVSDLTRSCEFVEHRDDGWWWDDPDFGRADLKLDSEPPRNLMLDLIEQVGKSAARGDEVKLPYDSIRPDPDQWWEGDASDGLEAPLGRAGARDLLALEVGEGTAQHALVAGRTGSGKSNLLQVLVTGLTLRYSPEELELYLVDFKQGVEFRDYAINELPHARAVAVDSDREFGLSVLEGLVEEMENRGERFRASGTDELAAYRRETGENLSRIFLLVDEFHHFFLEDDQKAHRADRLLEQLVREGRGFGIHVLLASQSLSGARSLSRTVIDQMSVRIALQCSAADSELILGKGNPAARLLNRPGDGFYNDAGGAKGSNERFQVAWLGDSKRRGYLEAVADMAKDRFGEIPSPIVFEGSQLAVLEEDEDHPILDLARAGQWPASHDEAAVAWLGEPVAIRSPTQVSFDLAQGKNLLVVGKDGKAVRGMFAGALLSLVVHHPPDDVRIHCVDWSGDMERFLTAVDETFPHHLERSAPSGFSNLLEKLTTELDERLQAGSASPAAAPGRHAVYLFLGGLGRCRELRRDDGFGYGDDDGPGPTKRLVRLLRDGPTVGIHTLCSAVAYRSLKDTLGRGSEAEFGYRVALAMDDRASSDLLGTVDGSKLEQNRALLYDEDRIGELEKFRPYREPDPEWISDLGRTVSSRRSRRDGNNRVEKEGSS